MSYESITIAVEPEEENLSDIKMKSYSDCIGDLEQIHGHIMFSSIRPEQKINLSYGTHPVYDGFLSAYKNHRPITISPDIFWLLITQAFANFVSSNSEKLRRMFVNFSGKKELHVVREDLNFFTMTAEDWETIFPEFVSKISKYTGKDITDTLKPDFTTTTPVSSAVGQLTIMSTMKHYFTFKVSVLGCGFPHITIEGSIEDWTKIVDKLTNLAKYKFEWFTKSTIPCINKIIETKKGNIDKQFWKAMFKVKDSHGMYNPGYVDGWLMRFFPYDKNGKRIDIVGDDDELQSEIQKIPFTLEIIGVDTFKCLFLAGFVGVSQDEKTKSIKPEIGWFIKRDDGSGRTTDDQSDSNENDIYNDFEDAYEDDTYYNNFDYNNRRFF